MERVGREGRKVERRGSGKRGREKTIKGMGKKGSGKLATLVIVLAGT